MENIQWYIGGLGLSIISYFLKKTMDELKETKQNFIEVSKKVAVIENDYNLKHTHLSEKIEDLSKNIQSLVTEIRNLNIELLKKN